MFSGTPKQNFWLRQCTLATLTNGSRDIGSKERHQLKFVSFLRKNADSPYLLDNTLSSSIFYGWESRVIADLAAANRIHLSALKRLLEARAQTSSLLVHVHADTGTMEAKLLTCRLFWIDCGFLKKQLPTKHYQCSGTSPLKITIELADASRCTMSK